MYANKGIKLLLLLMGSCCTPSCMQASNIILLLLSLLGKLIAVVDDHVDVDIDVVV